MSISINKNINSVVIAQPAASLIITDNRKGTTVTVSRTPDIITVTNLSGLQGPKGDTGPQGPAGSGTSQTGSFFISASVANAVITFTKGDASTSSVTVNSVVSASYAQTASYYAETDPIFVAKSGSFATTGSNIFKGNQTISGSNGRLIYRGTTPGAIPTLAEVHAYNDLPWLEKFYNDTYSTSSAVMAYFGWNDGRFVFHNESTRSIGLQVNGYNAENGLLVYSDKVAFVNNVEVTGSLNVIGAITGSLFGTATNALSSSYALTASYALNGSGLGFPFSGSAVITGSLEIKSNVNDIFIIKNFDNQHILTVSQSGVIVIATQSIDPAGTAPIGAIYFTSSSFFIGLD